MITAEPIDIQWNPSLPVFAKEDFLKAVGDEYGWVGGVDESRTLRCFLPYTIVRKGGLQLVRFRDATVHLGAELTTLEERSFLNSVVEYFRKVHADIIIPATNNSIFRTYPDGAEAAPYGSYSIDLIQPEEVLWGCIGGKMRQNIGSAQKDGVLIREGMAFVDPAYDLVLETFRRSRLAFMNRAAFKRFALALGDNGKLFMAEYQGVGQSYCLFAFSQHCAYAIYGGNAVNQHQGSNKLLLWEAIRLFRSLGVQKFDFFGARINPPKGSKQESINLLKKRFGAALQEGYLWKYSLRPWRALAYSIGVRLLRGGDIVDQEARRVRASFAQPAG